MRAHEKISNWVWYFHEKEKGQIVSKCAVCVRTLTKTYLLKTRIFKNLPCPSVYSWENRWEQEGEESVIQGKTVEWAAYGSDQNIRLKWLKSNL